jgi:metal-responsive CopG/Arc/MetJ family transcriptional regulator
MMMRTTVTLDDDVAAQLQREIRRTGKSFKEAVNEAVRAGLASRRVSAQTPAFVVEARPMGIVHGLDYSNVTELLEVAEGAKHR